MDNQPDPLSPEFQQALLYAAQLHRGQKRKSTRTPYLGHLLAVASLVLECGGTEAEATAALLHDAVEDQGGLSVLEDIRKTFGPEVAEIVDGCTDAYTVPKPPWKERKVRYLESLDRATPSVKLVSLADKVHNARSLHRELVRHGPGTWDAFKGGKAGTLWYYRELAHRLQDSPCPYLVTEFQQLVDRLHRTAENLE
jgi:(p)ppGpp synthase/HD superfamily hydrolase